MGVYKFLCYQLIRNFYQSRIKSSFQFSADANILNIDISDNNKKNISKNNNNNKYLLINLH